jgi:hypothetical protein
MQQIPTDQPTQEHRNLTITVRIPEGVIERAEARREALRSELPGGDPDLMDIVIGYFQWEWEEPEPLPDVADYRTVFVTSRRSGGRECFHTDSDCSHLRSAEVFEKEGGLDECPRCAAASSSAENNPPGTNTRAMTERLTSLSPEDVPALSPPRSEAER